MKLVKQKMTIPITNVDTKVNDLVIEKWTTNEQSVYGYVCYDVKRNLIGTKYFMEHISIREVTVHFRRFIRENRIVLHQ